MLVVTQMEDKSSSLESREEGVTILNTNQAHIHPPDGALSGDVRTCDTSNDAHRRKLMNTSCLLMAAFGIVRKHFFILKLKDL